MNKNHREQTQFSPEKKDSRQWRMGLLLSVYSLSAIIRTNEHKIIYFLNVIQDQGLHIIQYYNIYKTRIIMLIMI